MAVIDDGTFGGRIEGTIGGGAIENAVRQQALAAATDGKSRVVTLSLTHELAMCCGGTMTTYIEPLSTDVDCLVFGAGHISEALCRLGRQLGFSFTVADPRPELLNRERFPHARELISGYHHQDLEGMPFSAQALIVIATHSHEQDQALVEQMLQKPATFIALVGSKRKAMLTEKRCLAKELDMELGKRVFCPAGIDIGAETPEEIAISILAQMIEKRRCPSVR